MNRSLVLVWMVTLAACKGGGSGEGMPTAASGTATATAATSTDTASKKPDDTKTGPAARALFESHKAAWVECDKQRQAVIDRMQQDPNAGASGLMESRRCLDAWWSAIDAEAGKQGMAKDDWMPHFEKWNGEQLAKAPEERWRVAAGATPAGSAAPGASSAAPIASAEPASSAAPAGPPLTEGPGIAGLTEASAKTRLASTGWRLKEVERKDDFYGDKTQVLWLQFSVEGDEGYGWATRFDYSRAAKSADVGPKRTLFVSGATEPCGKLGTDLFAAKCTDYASCAAALKKLGAKDVDESTKPDEPVMGYGSGLLFGTVDDELCAVHFEDYADAAAGKGEMAVSASGKDFLAVEVSTNAADAQKIVKALCGG